MKEYIDKYINQGFLIFPCHADKTPCTPQGFKNAHNNKEILYKQFYKPDMLIGLPCGDGNGIVVIDIDTKDGRSVDELKEEIRQYGDLPPTYEVETMNGGRHLYYKIDTTILSAHTHFFDKSLPVDLRGNGSYVIAADYKKYFPLDVEDINDIKQYMSDLPDWIENYKKKNEYTETPDGEFLPESEVRELRSALSFISSDDREMWVNVGMALKNTRSVQAKGIWLEWSMKSEKFDPLDSEKKWKTFKPSDITIATIFHIAKQNGWVTTYENTPTILNESQINEKIKEIKTYEKKPFPVELLNPPGLVGDIANYMNSQSIRQQPVLSIAASLTFCGALMGRRFQDKTKIRTNIYCMGIGETGCGKENARSCIKDIIEACNDPNMMNLCMVENIASDTSIYSALTVEPSPIFILDEIGIFLKTTQNYQASHLAGIPAVLLKLFTSSTKRTSGKSYADTKKQITINNPNLCVYGTATPKQFFESLSKDNVEQGLMSRILIFDSDNSRPPANRFFKSSRPPQDLIDKVKTLYYKPINCNPVGNISEIEIVNPLVVPPSQEADEMLWNFNVEMDELYFKRKEEGGIYELYTRCYEIAKKIALIIAVGCDVYGKNPIIKPEHADYAIKLSRYLIEYLHDAVENKISENTLEKEVNKMRNIIRTKKKISQSELTRKFQYLESNKRKDIINTLIESKSIEKYEDRSNGKIKVFYIAV